MEVYSAENKTPLTQTKVVKSGDTVTFVFSDLKLNTVYSYKPRVYLTWYEDFGNTNISMSDFMMGTNNNIYVTTAQVKCDQYLLGEEKYFKTGTPSCKTGDLVDKSRNSAIVTCSYYDVEGFECGVIVTNNEKSFNVSTNNSEGEHEINITGLLPATTYTYYAYVVDTDGTTYYGVEKTFTTDLPDVTGTWTCREKHYKMNGTEYYTTYSVTLNEDGTASMSSDFGSYISAGWSQSKTGLSVNVTTGTSYFNGMYWAGSDSGVRLSVKFNDPINPTCGTGTANRWAVSAATGLGSENGYELEMTK